MSLLTGPPLWGASGLLPNLSIDLTRGTTGVDDEALYGAANDGGVGLSVRPWTLELLMKWIDRSRVAQTFVASEIGEEVAGPPRSSIRIRRLIPGGADTLQVILNGAGGGGLRDWQLDGIWTDSTWRHIVVVCDDVPVTDVFEVWVDGVDRSADFSKPTNVSSAMGSSSRTVSVGAGIPTPIVGAWDGYFFSKAIWSGDRLTGTEIAALSANRRRDRRANFGGYASSATLDHYWCPAINSSADAFIGVDYGITTPNTVDLMNRALRVTIADYVADAP